MIARSQPRSVALATARKVADLWAGDRLLLQELRRRGLRSEPIVWDDDAVDWRAWDVVLIRSCWDYHLQVERFRAWLDRLERDGVRVMNPPALVRWNIHKRYLFDVARNGVRIPPTRVTSRDSGGSLAVEIDDAGWLTSWPADNPGAHAAPNRNLELRRKITVAIVTAANGSAHVHWRSEFRSDDCPLAERVPPRDPVLPPGPSDRRSGT